MKRLNAAISDGAHKNLLVLREVLKKKNIDSTLEEIINRLYEEVAGK